MDFVKANFPVNEVIEIIKLYPFEIKTEDLKFQDLGGVPNNNYRLWSSNFDVVVKVYSHGQSDKEKIHLELEVMDLFRKKGLRVPKLYKSKNNLILQEYKGFNVSVSSYISGISLDMLKFSSDRMRNVGN